MAHTTKDKAKLLSRVQRFGDRWKLLSGRSTANKNFTRASAHGGLSSCLERPDGGVLEGHLRFHVLDPKSGKNAPQLEAAENSST